MIDVKVAFDLLPSEIPGNSRKKKDHKEGKFSGNFSQRGNFLKEAPQPKEKNLGTSAQRNTKNW
ncbi:hypothetical protein SDC9_172630 [bioreactor metagenome]|uniref:Uncharacterized protein n=1 Tax=bioreactor metagenome TaxID=1076179 RepID=A0A645GNE5_9ZZZZ